MKHTSYLSIFFVMLWVFAVGHCLAESNHFHQVDKGVPFHHHHHNHSHDADHADHQHSHSEADAESCEILAVKPSSQVVTAAGVEQLSNDLFFENLFITALAVALSKNDEPPKIAQRFTFNFSSHASILSSLSSAPNAPPALIA